MAKSKGLKLTRKWLYEQYIVLGKTTTEIGLDLKVSLVTICYHLKKQNIPMRTPSEQKMGSRNPMFGKHYKRQPMSEKTRLLISSKVPRGINHFRYKPPSKRMEPVNVQIRTCIKYKQWRHAVLKRNNGVGCALCSSKKNLEVDHIVPFAVIKRKFRIKTLKSALLCKKLWSTSNGRVLCHECHLNTDSYGGKIKQKTIK